MWDHQVILKFRLAGDINRWSLNISGRIFRKIEFGVSDENHE